MSQLSKALDNRFGSAVNRMAKVIIASLVPIVVDAVIKQVLPNVQKEVIAQIPDAVKPLAVPIIASLILAAEKYLKYETGTK